MKTIKLLLVAAMVFASGISFAGYQNNTTVTFGTDVFYGSLHATRNSANSTEYMGCYINGATDAITCIARNAAGQYRSCTIANPDKGDHFAASSVSSSTYLYVTHSGGACTRIQAVNGSYMLP